MARCYSVQIIMILMDAWSYFQGSLATRSYRVMGIRRREDIGNSGGDKQQPPKWQWARTGKEIPDSGFQVLRSERWFSMGEKSNCKSNYQIETLSSTVVIPRCYLSSLF